MRIGAVILAAGFSRRLGRPKQEVELQGETLLARAVRIANEAALDPVIAVVQDSMWQQRLQASATMLVNARAAEGMATSVVLGAKHAQELALDGVILMTCDQPALTPQHLRALCKEGGRVTASNYAGRNGVPAFFPASAFPLLHTLEGDAGARKLLQNAAVVINEALSLDIDTEEDLDRAKAQFEEH